MGTLTGTIKLWKGVNAWFATFSDPHVRELFGTDTLPTAFTERAPGLDVLHTIQAKNPGCTVMFL